LENQQILALESNKKIQNGDSIIIPSVNIQAYLLSISRLMLYNFVFYSIKTKEETQFKIIP
ncbi:hypothetical protein, partial [Staphylococcus aureus]|uniref:hypothetical protein n=1 Tax=Staphylococcus aureus TaxID=1280 RepID=UPI001E539AAD